MNNVELRNDYAQGKWQGTFPSGSILKGYGFSCDVTIKTESGLKKAEFTIPRSESGDSVERFLCSARAANRSMSCWSFLRTSATARL